MSRLGPDRGAWQSAWGGVRLDPRVAVTSCKDGKYPAFPKLEARPVNARGGQPGGGRKSKQARAKQARVKRLAKRQSAMSYSTVRPKPRAKPAPPSAEQWDSPKGELVLTEFRRFYDRNDIPVCVEHGAKRRVQWKEPIERLDYHYYLPLFFKGLRETQEPYTFLAFAGVKDLLEHGGDKVLPVVPDLVQPLREALNTKNRKTIRKVLEVLQCLVKTDRAVGEALVVHYRQLLGIFNAVLTLEPRANLGDRMDYAQQKRHDLVDLVNETLELLEKTGGEHAFQNIKYMVPTYESATIW